MQGIAVGPEGARPAFVQKLFEGVRVLVYGLRPLTEPEFDAHLAEAAAMAPSVRAVMVVLVDDLGGLRPSWRAKLARKGLLQVPTAVISDSIRVRGMLTPINWLGGNVRPFATHEFAQAFDFLDMPDASRPFLVEQITGMLAEVGVSRPLHKVDSNRTIGATLQAIKRAVIHRVTTMRKKGRPHHSP